MRTYYFKTNKTTNKKFGRYVFNNEKGMPCYHTNIVVNPLHKKLEYAALQDASSKILYTISPEGLVKQNNRTCAKAYLHLTLWEKEQFLLRIGADTECVLKYSDNKKKYDLWLKDYLVASIVLVSKTDQTILIYEEKHTSILLSAIPFIRWYIQNVAAIPNHNLTLL